MNRSTTRQKQTWKVAPKESTPGVTVDLNRTHSIYDFESKGVIKFDRQLGYMEGRGVRGGGGEDEREGEGENEEENHPGCCSCYYMMISKNGHV